MKRSGLLPMLVGCLTVGVLNAESLLVGNSTELRTQLSKLKDGDELVLKPGVYSAGWHVRGIAHLTVRAEDPENPPLFQGGKVGWHFSKCENLSVRDLQIQGQSLIGINVDDGGDYAKPVKGVKLSRLKVSDIGPVGNHDAIKFSGISHSEIVQCKIEGWGGQGIDLVGCHNITIRECHLKGKEGFSASAGIQVKGGSEKVLIELCHFENAGMRPLNLGGSTGLAYFRPAGTKYEAKDLTARNNLIEGGDCAASFVGLDGGVFENNQVWFPQRWIFRILQETKEEGFIPCRNVKIQNNKIQFRRRDIRSEINVSEGTSVESFQFEKNQWFAEDLPLQSKPKLPVEEREGIYGKALEE